MRRGSPPTFLPLITEERYGGRAAAMNVVWTPETSGTPAAGQHDLGHVHLGAVPWSSPVAQTSQKTLELRGLKKLK